MTDPDREHKRAIHISMMAEQGEVPSLSILKADFGHWPPQGLDIVRPPAKTTEFQKYTAPLGFLTTAYVDNSESANRIYINRAASLSALFNLASADFADTVSHEHIHILQKNMMRAGISDPFGRNRKHKLNDAFKPFIGSMAKYLCEEDETQVRIHQIVAHHYRQFQQLPLNPHELWALLKVEGVKINSPLVDSMLDSAEGIKARYKFSTSSYKSGLIKPGIIREMSTIFWCVQNEKRDDYCKNVFTALYGQLLELYGDQDGSRRMGLDHNLSLTEVFFRQAWSLQHKWNENLPADTKALEATIQAMPLAQTEDLLEKLLDSGVYHHPVVRRDFKLEPQAASRIIPYLARHTEFGALHNA
ncbi:MAG: hypothetical protein ACXW30_01225 [Micavibrio sp.]